MRTDMKDDFIKNTGLAVVLLVALFAIHRLPRYLPRSSFSSYVATITGMMHNGELNADDLHTLTAGITKASRTPSASPPDRRTPIIASWTDLCDTNPNPI